MPLSALLLLDSPTWIAAVSLGWFAPTTIIGVLRRLECLLPQTGAYGGEMGLAPGEAPHRVARDGPVVLPGGESTGTQRATTLPRGG